jgi:DNA-binding winged helix-turn-helix (wHTH) protein/serine/threonine protein kinase
VGNVLTELSRTLKKDKSMAANELGASAHDTPARVWRFADCELDELRRQLRVHGALIDLESKPLEVLIQLLHHAGEVVTKEELLESVWPGTLVVDGSLATAVSKLRKAIGDESQSTVLTVARIGYRLSAPVQSKAIEPGGWGDSGLNQGDAVPGRDHWRLMRRMDLSGSSEVWLAENPKTHETRVFKFAADGVQLKGLKREVTLARLLRQSLGDRPDYVRVLEWNFEAPPFFLESEYGGTNLAEWAASQGGLAKVPQELRLRLLIDIAKAVAAAHDIGVLHKDLKPANILIVRASDAAANGSQSPAWQVKVADFGSGALADPERLGALGITNLGFTRTTTPDSLLTGTLTYLAPEVLAGHSPTISADVYALGVILYQLVAGDFRKPLSPGWEADIDDPVLREDIAEAACGDLELRLKSAADLAERLENLERRGIERDKVMLAEKRALVAERKLSEARARRPWITLALAALVLGMSTSLVLYRKAARDRDLASRQTAIAGDVNRFLANDLLGRSSPFTSGKADESLLDAVKQASPGIDRQFANEPLVAAQLHHTIARALDARTDYPDARQEYDRAASLYLQSEGPLSQGAIIVQLQRAALEARSYQAGTLDLAKSILTEQEPKISKLAQTRDELPVWLYTARGMIALIGNNAQSAKDNFQAASDKATNVSAIDDHTRLALRQRLGFSYIRMGDGAEAERIFRELIDLYSRTTGPDTPEILRVRLNLAQAFMIENKNAEAVDETNRIYPAFVAKLGPDHELTMQVLGTREQSEATLGRFEDATRDGLELYRLDVKKQGPSSFFSIAALADVSLAQCRSGHVAEGLANAHNSYETSRKAFGERAGLTGAAAYSLASCDIETSRFEDASRLLDNIDFKVVAQLTGLPDWSANLDLARADIAFRRGDYSRARTEIQLAVPVFSRADAEPYQKRKLGSLLAEIDAHQAPTSR